VCARARVRVAENHKYVKSDHYIIASHTVTYVVGQHIKQWWSSSLAAGRYVEWQFSNTVLIITAAFLFSVRSGAEAVSAS